MEEWEVWEEVPISDCLSATGRKPLGGRWVDCNKGDLHQPDVRSRWVAKDIAFQKSDEFFAATPPLEAMRLILREAASQGAAPGKELKVMLLDAKKAHLHAMAERPIYVQLPPERARPGYCCRLIRSLYGTRDAPRLWEEFAASCLSKLGFLRGKACAVCFRHPQRQVMCLMHGDDFLMAVRVRDLEWTRDQLSRDILLSDKGRLGGGHDEVREIKCLNRVLRWTPTGYQVEADPRHAEIIVTALGDKVRTVVTPGAKETATAKRGSTRPAAEEDATEFSARVSARAEKVADLQQQVRDLDHKNAALTAQLAQQQGSGVSSVAAPAAAPDALSALAFGATEVFEHTVGPECCLRQHPQAHARAARQRAETADDAAALEEALDAHPPGRAAAPSHRWRHSLCKPAERWPASEQPVPYATPGQARRRQRQS